MRASRLVVCMLLAMAGSVLAEGRPRLAVVVPKLQANGRLMAFDLKIRGGQVSMFRTVPAGWTITIDNDPSWNGSVAGQAVVGAAALDASELSRMFTVSPPPGAVDGEPLALSGSITVMVNGDETTQEFSAIKLAPTPAP